MPLNNSRTKKTRQKYHELNTYNHVDTREEAPESHAEEGLTREGLAKKKVAKEDELIWAWSRDPQSDLTQIEARDRAQSDLFDYGRYNISQSSVSRKLSKMDDTMFYEGILSLEGWQIFDNERIYEGKLNDNPVFLDAMRDMIAKFLCDRFTLYRFDHGGKQTPQWAQDRFPDMDPNLGRKATERMAKRTGYEIENICGGLHEPHD